MAGILYTGISTPMTSILPNLTNDPEQRTVLNSYRMVGGNIGLLIANSVVLPLVQLFGQGNDRKGFSITMIVMGGRIDCSLLNCLLEFKRSKCSINTVYFIERKC